MIPVPIEAVEQREIYDVVHFTTSAGLVGIFAKNMLLPRAQLASDDYLEHIYRPNSKIRYEARKYWEYVNLSISSVNNRFFSISQGWHPTQDNLFWAILHFDPVILTHPEVLFSPGNMAYRGIVPEGGRDGFEAIFANKVPCGFGGTRNRVTSLAANLPTDPQAEVLYPGGISTVFLRQVTVADNEDAASVEGIVSAFCHPEVPVVVDPSEF